MESWREELYASEYGSQYLMHHGIKGQIWGRRRYQNEDGSLTEEGKKRYGQDNPNGEFNKARDEGYDKVLDYQASQSKGKQLVKMALFGESGRMTYDMARKLGGQSRVRAAINAAFGFGNFSQMAGVAAGGSVSAAIGSKKNPWNDDYSDKDTLRDSIAGVAGTAASRATDYAISKEAQSRKMATSLLQKRLLDQYAEQQLRKKKKNG